MKSLLLLWKVLAIELASICHTSAIRDYQTVANRFEHEGDRFLAVTLPTYAKSLERALDEGKVTPYLFDGFHRRGELPVLFGGFVEKVFNRETGVLLDEPCIRSIFAMRQLALFFGKMAPPGDSHPAEASTMLKFVQCEQEIKVRAKENPPELLPEFQRMAQTLFGDVFQNLELASLRDEFIPKHGPGATADRLKGNLKWDQREWPLRLEAAFPFGDYVLPSWRFNLLLDDVDFLEPGAERPVRVITVPKTFKTPRIIAIEPTCMQYAQQAILGTLVPGLERDSFLSPFVGFTYQTPNQRMAREGSLNGGLATLDLSEASDRVLNQHVIDLIGPRYPYFSKAVQACRSTKADVPGHGVIRLAKFASMGSALCFPFEEMVFLTIIFTSIEASLSTRFTRKDIKHFVGKVRVYGDDIVVPVEHVQCVIAGLESFGMKVNGDKSFWTGSFRESCGKEYYAGTDVSIVRARKSLPRSRRQVPEVIATVEMRNQFFSAGLYSTVAALDEIIEKVLPHFPVVESTSPGLGKWSNEPVKAQKHHSRLQKPLVRAYVVKSKPPRSRASGEGSLMKWFTKHGDLPIADVDHLEHAGRPQKSYLKLRWVSPF